jgi:hypothetical protein
MAWDDDKRQQAIDMYVEAEPTPENSMEIVKGIAEELDESPNGVRMILTKAEVYVKKAVAASAKAIEALSATIRDAGQEVDDDVVSKLTGKAAVYFNGIIEAINN